MNYNFQEKEQTFRAAIKQFKREVINTDLGMNKLNYNYREKGTNF